MKNFKRISSLIVALVMIVATMSAMFVTSSAVAAGDKYTFDFFMTKSDASNMKVVDENGIWAVGGADRTTGAFLPVIANDVVDNGGGWYVLYTDADSKASRGAVIGCPENSMGVIDIIAFGPDRGTYDGAIAFTTPVDGTYTFAGEFYFNYFDNDTSCYVYKLSGTTKTDIGTPYVAKKDEAQPKTVFEQKGEVELKKGEMIVIAGTYASDRGPGKVNNCRMGVKSLEVTVKSVASSGSTPSTQPLATYTLDCALAPVGQDGTKTVTDNWQLAAIKKGTSDVFPVDTATKATWGTYYGVWPNDPNAPEGTKYTHSNTEKPDFAILDIVTWQAVEYDAAIIFTAPESGEYSFNTKLKVISADYNEVANTVYVLGASEKIKNDIIPQSQRNAEFTQEGTVTLKKGDKLVFATECTANTTAGKANRTAVGEITVSLLKKASTPSTPSNPTTGDAFVVSFAVAVVAGVAIVASKKRR